MSAHLRLGYLPANQCWAFVFGDSLVGMGDRTLFASRDDAVEAASRQGLVVHPNGHTEAIAAPRGGAS